MKDQSATSHSGNYRRKTANLLLEPGLQLKLPLYFLLLSSAFCALMAATIRSAYQGFYDAIVGELPASVENILSAQTQDLAVVSAMMAVGYLLSVLAVSIVQSHRLVGPGVALRRQVEAMKNGDYSVRVRLRRNDAFVALAEDLNQLADLLERREKD